MLKVHFLPSDTVKLIKHVFFISFCAKFHTFITKRTMVPYFDPKSPHYVEPNRNRTKQAKRQSECIRSIQEGTVREDLYRMRLYRNAMRCLYKQDL